MDTIRSFLLENNKDLSTDCRTVIKSGQFTRKVHVTYILSIPVDKGDGFNDFDKMMICTELESFQQVDENSEIHNNIFRTVYTKLRDLKKQIIHDRTTHQYTTTTRNKIGEPPAPPSDDEPYNPQYENNGYGGGNMIQNSSEGVPPNRTTNTMQQSSGDEEKLRKKLTEMKLDKFIPNFIDEGYDVDFFEDITQDDLKQMGLKKGHLLKWKKFYPFDDIQAGHLTQMASTPQQIVSDTVWAPSQQPGLNRAVSYNVGGPHSTRKTLNSHQGMVPNFNIPQKQVTQIQRPIVKQEQKIITTKKRKIHLMRSILARMTANRTVLW
eukprot:UN30829